MGGIFNAGKLEGFDFKSAWNDAVAESIARFGNDPYSGGINTIHNMRYMGLAPFKEKDAYDYVVEHHENLDGREGVYYDLGVVKYAIINTVYEKQPDDYNFRRMQVDCRSVMGRGPALMLVSDDLGRVRGYGGTFANLKKEAHVIARNMTYANDILIKNSSGDVYAVNGSVKWVEKTKRRSDDNTLVKAWHRYYFGGWCQS